MSNFAANERLMMLGLFTPRKRPEKDTSGHRTNWPVGNFDKPKAILPSRGGNLDVAVYPGMFAFTSEPSASAVINRKMFVGMTELTTEVLPIDDGRAFEVWHGFPSQDKFDECFEVPQSYRFGGHFNFSSVPQEEFPLTVKQCTIGIADGEYTTIGTPYITSLLDTGTPLESIPYDAHLFTLLWHEYEVQFHNPVESVKFTYEIVLESRSGLTYSATVGQKSVACIVETRYRVDSETITDSATMRAHPAFIQQGDMNHLGLSTIAYMPMGTGELAVATTTYFSERGSNVTPSTKIFPVSDVLGKYYTYEELSEILLPRALSSSIGLIVFNVPMYAEEQDCNWFSSLQGTPTGVEAQLMFLSDHYVDTGSKWAIEEVGVLRIPLATITGNRGNDDPFCVVQSGIVSITVPEYTQSETPVLFRTSYFQTLVCVVATRREEWICPDNPSFDGGDGPEWLRGPMVWVTEAAALEELSPELWNELKSLAYRQDDGGYYLKGSVASRYIANSPDMYNAFAKQQMWMNVEADYQDSWGLSDADLDGLTQLSIQQILNPTPIGYVHVMPQQSTWKDVRDSGKLVYSVASGAGSFMGMLKSGAAFAATGGAGALLMFIINAFSFKRSWERAEDAIESMEERRKVIRIEVDTEQQYEELRKQYPDLGALQPYEGTPRALIY